MEPSSPAPVETAKTPETEPQSVYDRVMIDVATIAAVLAVLNYVYYLWFSAPACIDIYRSLRIDLPLPTQFFVALVNSPSLVLLIAGLNFACIAIVRRRRYRTLAVAVAIFSLLFGYAASESVLLPLKKIQQSLRKK